MTRYVDYWYPFDGGHDRRVLCRERIDLGEGAYFYLTVLVIACTGYMGHDRT